MEASLKPKKLTTFNILHFEIRYGLPVNFKVFRFLTIYSRNWQFNPANFQLAVDSDYTSTFS